MENKETKKPITYRVWFKWLVVVARLVVGAVFIFSGFVKGVDPMGSVYKFDDYFVAFGFEFLSPFSLFFAVVLAAFEFILGINLFLGSYRRSAPGLALLLMLFMTPLTLYLAIKNPVSDCGCFGDALLLTNWQTFYKNVVLLLLIVFLCLYNGRARGVYNRPVQWITVLYSLLFILTVIWVGYNFQPILDFRPYKSGLDLRQALENESEEEEMGEFIFIYEKDGLRQEFSLDDCPVDDTAWVFVDRIEKEVPVNRTETSVADFMIISPEGEVTGDILADENYTFLLMSPDIAVADNSEIDRINEIYDYALANGYGFYCVTPSSQEEIEEWQDDTGAEYPFYFMDKTAIKTVMRSNPGMMLLKDGRIYWKRSALALPDESKLTVPLEELPFGQLREYNARRRIVFVSLVYLLPMLLLLLTEKTVMAIISRWRARQTKRRLQRQARQETQTPGNGGNETNG
ncbi:MAG: DoxX family protein [Coprobacter sp.]|nr:DoxX family protein [Coprobacter sp.]